MGSFAAATNCSGSAPCRLTGAAAAAARKLPVSFPGESLLKFRASQRSRMSYEYSYRRTARSLSPQPISYTSLQQRRNSLTDHVDNIITRSRLADQYRAKSVEPFS